MTDKKHIKFKISLLGNPGVGKTSLIQKYVFNFFGDVYIRTMGTKVSKKVIQLEPDDDETPYEITMMIWDIMGQKIQSVLHKTYFKFSKGALIVCDVTRNNTLQDSEEWARNLLAETGEIPLVFLANKNDLDEQKLIQESDIRELAEKFDAPFYFTSAKTGENVNQAFYRLGKLMLENSLKKRPVAKDANEVKDGVAEGAEPPKETNIFKELNVRPGGSYLIKEEKPVKCFQIFNKLIKGGIKGLCVTRTHPNMVKDEYEVSDVSIQWLSSGTQETDTISPTELSDLTHVISQHIQNNPGSAIVLEGIEYLIDHNDFKTILKTIHSINDEIMRSNSILIVPLDPYVLEQRELHLLSRNLLSL